VLNRLMLASMQDYDEFGRVDEGDWIDFEDGNEPEGAQRLVLLSIRGGKLGLLSEGSASAC
jgi:hypothetical protein